MNNKNFTSCLLQPVCIVSVDVAGDYEEVQKAVQKVPDKQFIYNPCLKTGDIINPIWRKDNVIHVNQGFEKI